MKRGGGCQISETNDTLLFGTVLNSVEGTNSANLAVILKRFKFLFAFFVGYKLLSYRTVKVGILTDFDKIAKLLP